MTESVIKLSHDNIGACFFFFFLVLTQEITSSCQWDMYARYYECIFFFKNLKIHCFLLVFLGIFLEAEAAALPAKVDRCVQFAPALPDLCDLCLSDL